MPNDDPNTDPQGNDPDPQANAEESFWKKFDERLSAGVSAAVDKKLKEFRENSTSRTSGRKTVPGIIADLMFGETNKK